MRVFIKFQRVPRTAVAVVLAMLLAIATGCGNKGSLYLDGTGLFVRTAPTIDDALNELEVMELQEAAELDTRARTDEQEEKEL